MVPSDAIDQPASALCDKPAGSDLCRDCGLCCDGCLFGGVDLEQGEVDAAVAKGLQPIVGEQGARFSQPCPRFCGICEIYPDRPLHCRKYRCLLLARLERGEVDFASAHAVVVEAQRLARAADMLALPGENRGTARQRWSRVFRAVTGGQAHSSAQPSADNVPPADPRWLVR